MKKIFYLIVLFFFITPLNLLAVNNTEISLENDLGIVFQNGDTVCANREYMFSTPNDYTEVLVLDSETHVILDVLNSNSSLFTIVFPENAESITIVVSDYNDDKTIDKSSEKTIDLIISPCEYEVVKENYKAIKPKAKVVYKDGFVTIEAPINIEKYTFDYQLLGGRTKTLSEEDTTFKVEMEDAIIFQFIESYQDDKETSHSKYFELEINSVKDTYRIRNVDSFSINKIEADYEVVFRYLIILICLIVMLLIVRILRRRVKKKYRKQKKKNLRRSK